MTKNKQARQITILRQDNGVTQSELAQIMGVSVRTVSGWETGDRPPKNWERLLGQITLAFQGQDAPDQGINFKDGEEDIYRKKYEDLMERHILLLEELRLKEKP